MDAELDALAARARALALEAEDLLHELHRYAEGVEAAPGRLDEVEERLALLDRLKRKHGGTIAAVLAHAAVVPRAPRRAGRRRGGDRDQPRASWTPCAPSSPSAPASSPRRASAAGAELAAAVRDRLTALAMEGAEFTAAVSPRDDGFGPTGADEIEFLIAPNPGVPAGPLREIASGGELSRVMLALMGVAAEAGPATLVFDEVDAGIGGQTARAVGEQLRALAAGRQVLCITHLPQIASLADRHFTIVKDTSGETARTTVTELKKADVVGELVRMLGADREDAAARRHAKELLKAA